MTSTKFPLSVRRGKDVDGTVPKLQISQCSVSHKECPAPTMRRSTWTKAQWGRGEQKDWHGEDKSHVKVEVVVFFPHTIHVWELMKSSGNWSGLQLNSCQKVSLKKLCSPSRLWARSRVWNPFWGRPRLRSQDSSPRWRRLRVDCWRPSTSWTSARKSRRGTRRGSAKCTRGETEYLHSLLHVDTFVILFFIPP